MTIYRSHVIRSSEIRVFSRNVYNIYDLLGDVGGLIEALVMVFGFFLTKISEFKFNIRLIQALFMAKACDSKIFNGKKTIFDNKEVPQKYMKKEDDDKNKAQYPSCSIVMKS